MAKKRTGMPGWDHAPKVRSDAKLKNLPEADQETLWVMLHPTEVGQDPRSLEEVLVHIEADHGFSVSLSTLSEWRSWYALQRRMNHAAERAQQARLELAKDPNISPDDIERIAQTVFTAETLEAGNVKGYVALAKLQLARNKQQIERDKLSASIKSKLEAGLDALMEEIQGNPRAMAKFNELKEVVSKG
jgi:hypothetical protein